MRGELEAVGAGDGNAASVVLERTHQRMHETVAAAHQDDDVAGTDPFARRLVDLAIGDPAGDRVGDAIGQLNGGGRGMIDRLRPVVGLVFLLGRDRRPQLDIARRAGADRGVLDVLLVVGQAGAPLLVGKDEVDRAENVFRRAEGVLQLDRCEAADGFDLAAELETAFGKRRRLGALERVDRLLLVTDGENGAGDAVARPETREELGRQRLDDGPLLRARVLRLVDQDVVDAAIELVVHPGAGVLARKQSAGADNKVVEIEKAAHTLQALVPPDQPVGEPQCRARRAQHAQKGDPVLHREQMACRLTVAVDKVGEALLKRGLERLRAVRIAVRLEQPLCQKLQRPDGIGRLECGGDMRDDAVEHGAGIGCVCLCHQRVEFAAREAGKRPHRFGEVLDRVGRREPEFLEQLGIGLRRMADPVDELAQRIALGDDFGEQRLEPAFAAGFQHVGKGFRQLLDFTRRHAGEQIAPGLGDERGLLLRVEQLEMPGDVRLQRKLVQDRLAEGVDGLDLEPTRRL